MTKRKMSLAALQTVLHLDKDELPFNIEICDNEVVFECANTEQRPPTAQVCAYRADGYTMRVTYRPESNDFLFKHAGPSIKYTKTIDEFKEGMNRDRFLSDNQYARAKLYVNREWDGHTCDECGKLITDEEVSKLKQVAEDHPEEVTGALCQSHQESLYSLMEYNPWEPEYNPNGDNEVRFSQ